MQTPLSRLLLVALTAGSPLPAQGDLELKNALGDDKLGNGWIYEDIEAGYALAKKTGKPLLVAFR